MMRRRNAITVRLDLNLNLNPIGWPTPIKLALGYWLFATGSNVFTPTRHSLLVSSISWTILCLYFWVKNRDVQVDAGHSQKATLAGALFTAALVCGRVAGDKNGVWMTTAILPPSTFAIARLLASGGRSREPFQWTAYPARLLFAMTITALTALANIHFTNQVILLGAASTAATATALCLAERVLTEDASGHGQHDFESHSEDWEEPKRPSLIECLSLYKSFVATALLGSVVSTLFLEGVSVNDWILRMADDDGHATWRANASLRASTLAVVFTTAQYYLLLRMISCRGATPSAVCSLGAIITAHWCSNPGLWTGWLIGLYYFVSLQLRRADGSLLSGSEDDEKPIATGKREKSFGTILSLLALGSLAFRAWFPLHDVARGYYSESHGPNLLNSTWTPFEAFGPLEWLDRSTHPIKVLVQEAAVSFNKTLSRQSTTIQQAATEYRRRYGIHPPPNFDRWFEFAKSKGVVLIDEFDTIHECLLPFWSLPPRVLRDRISEALGYEDNGLMSLFVRNGRITSLEGFSDWARTALRENVEGFVEHLPDLDIAFNVHDEPRVIVPHSDLAQMVHVAKTVHMPAALAVQSPRNSFSRKPKDMKEGEYQNEVSTTRFNKYHHEATWSHCRLSCPPESPAGDFTGAAPDNRTAWALDDLGFIYNYTAFTDICLSPSLRTSYGFFDRPNLFWITQDLMPIFSQSKLSSFQDIVYPSPWYWANKVPYNERDDPPWEQKQSKLYWRGSTTGGYSRAGGWRRHHRQRAVQALNAPKGGRIMANTGTGSAPDWTVANASKQDYRDAIDVHFSDVGQCDAGDCAAQTEFFHVAKHAEQQSAWRFKHLLDMDGNAFSGRFHAFLKSRSLVFKIAIFREWHADWLKPWLHYVPLSLTGDERLEVVRWFGAEDGREMAEEMAGGSAEWAGRALRREDMQVWMFRLLLEYGRIMDDDREVIGYAGP